MSVNVVLLRDVRGLGAAGETYECANEEVAEKLIRLGHVAREGASVEEVKVDNGSTPVGHEEETPALSQRLDAIEDIQTAPVSSTQVDEVVPDEVADVAVVPAPAVVPVVQSKGKGKKSKKGKGK